MFAFGAAAAPADAQLPLRSQRAAAAMPTAYSDPHCQLSGSSADDAVLHLQAALVADQPEIRASELEQGRANLYEAILRKNRNGSAKVWYTLAQIYLYQGDLAGGDSALRHAQALAPACAPVLDSLRYMVWAPLVNAGADFAKAGANDSALVLFQQAAAIYPDQPHPLLSAGILLANAGRIDSAIVYFERAATAAEHANLTEQRNQATRNLAAMLQRTGRHQEAAAALQRYLEWQPDDREAKRGLAVAYRAIGRTAEARALESELGAAPAETPDDALRVAVNLYQEQKFAEAAEAFARVRAAFPYNRDAIRGLAASYQELNDGPRLVEAAGRLVELEPLSVDALRLLSVGYQLTKQTDRAVEVATRLVGSVTGVTVGQLRVTGDSASVAVNAIGRAAETASGKRVPPSATAVVFDFVDAQGEVVASRDVVIPALKPNEAATLTVQARGKGIVAWRYRRKAS